MSELTDFVPHPGSRMDAVAQDAAAQANDVPDAEYGAPEGQFAVQVTERAAIFGGYMTYVFGGTEATPYRIVPRDDFRARAYLLCSGTGPVYVSTSKASLEALRANGQPSSGMIPGVAVLASGMALPITHQESVLVMPDGTHSAVVTVAMERWSND
jgi:hypothetical protein